MSITDELREFIETHLYLGATALGGWKEAAFAIADRIDAEYQKAEDEWKVKDGQTWLRGYAECHAELMEGNEVIAEDLEKAGCIHYDPERHYCSVHGDTESGWVRLPKDADGEYIRIGDVVTCGEAVWTVTGLRFLGEGWSICCTVYNKYGGSGTSFYPPSDLRHYHAPTVEDILREFALRAIRESEGNYGDLDETCAEYAKRLRLAGEDE